MEKTKLGISVSLFAAIMFFSGTMNFVVAALIAGYVLLKEDDEWLKRSAVKMLVILVTFGVLSNCVGLIQYVFSVLTYIIRWFSIGSVEVPLNLDYILNCVFGFASDALLILLGLKALSKGTIRIKFIDNILNKHMN